MHLICAYSGLQFDCEYFPGSLYGPEICHPVFQFPQRKLLTYLPKWFSGELTDTDSYLLFIAILHSTDLVHFRLPVKRTTKSASIVAKFMHPLADITQKINTVSRAESYFPHYVISADTNDLSNVHHWIENWKDKYDEYHSGAARSSAHDMSKIIRREASLERLIKNPHKPISAYASELARWAATAGNFPEFSVLSRLTGQHITCSDYWIDIITRCASDSEVWRINDNDLFELLEHCRREIPAGSIFSSALFRLLQKAETKITNFMGLGDLDAQRGTIIVLHPSDSVEDANMQTLISQAPENEPKLSDYPTKFQYTRAKLRWDMARRHGNSGTGTGVQS